MQDLIDALRGYVRNLPIANIGEVTVDGLVNELRKIPKFDSSREVNDPILENLMGGVTFWHGSPHKWLKPNASKFRSGEGEMSKGEGLYASTDEALARHYAMSLRDSPKPGYLYKMNYPDSEYEKFLRPDNPFSQQHPLVQKALREIDEAFVRNSPVPNPVSPEEFLGGAEFHKRANLDYKNLWPWMSKAESRVSPIEDIIGDEMPIALSRELSKRGVRGLEYLDKPVSMDYAQFYNKPVSVIYPDTLDMVDVLRRMVVK